IDDFISSRTRGEMKLHNANFEIGDSRIDFHGFEGEFSFSNKDLIVHRLSGKLSSSNFTLKGRFKNMTPWLFIPGEKIGIDARVVCRNINLDELMLDSNTRTDSVYKLAFNENVKFDLDFEVGHFSFRKFRAKNVKGNVGFDRKKLKVSETSFESMDGSSLISGLIDGARPDKFLLKCNADFQNVDIHKLFYQMGNFGQQNITSENLSGEVNANVYFKADMTPQLRISPESVYTSADLQIKNGELRDYAPVYRLATFIKMEELRNIKFSTINNHIEIKDKVVYIPEMEINSSTLNLQLQGSHSFDNQIDYHFSLYLSDLLHRKKKETENPEYIVHEDESGKPRIYLSMTGIASDPVIKYDMKAVRKNISSDIRKERENLKAVFKKEFSGKKETEEESPYFEKQDSTQRDFIIQWDEEDADSLETTKPKKKTREKKLPGKKDKDFIISFDEEEDDTIK
ncbi:MAG: AsmA-like C-terminal region-containing protein, partial [Chlorobi bacterium]|nr:AsmA-like C-terminal region-containing protein [Chlorobiota bacterium]